MSAYRRGFFEIRLLVLFTFVSTTVFLFFFLFVFFFVSSGLISNSSSIVGAWFRRPVCVLCARIDSGVACHAWL
jgi:hypothetical protein